MVPAARSTVITIVLWFAVILVLLPFLFSSDQLLHARPGAFLSACAARISLTACLRARLSLTHSLPLARIGTFSQTSMRHVGLELLGIFVATRGGLAFLLAYFRSQHAHLEQQAAIFNLMLQVVQFAAGNFVRAMGDLDQHAL